MTNKPNFSQFHSKYGFHQPEKYVYKSKGGFDEKLIKEISRQKAEPDWMRSIRLDAYKKFKSLKLPQFGPDLSGLNLSKICYYLKPTEKKANSWKDLPKEIKDTYDRIGIPEAEKKYLGGISAQYESEVVYKSIKKTLSQKGVIFTNLEEAVSIYPTLVREYFGKVVPSSDNIFAALNTAVWSGGSFIYVPKGVKVKLPLQAYFRINAANMGQFERTLIIADEGSFVHYVEGCTAPIYSSDSLHAAVVEIMIKKEARVRYTTIQNWSKNVYNLVTKRMHIHKDAIGEWIDGNLGSKITMKYPSMHLLGSGARGEMLSIAYATHRQIQDTGGIAIHMAPNTSSQIISKSVSSDGGRTSYRGVVKMFPEAINAKSKVICDALIVDGISRSDTYPKMDIRLDEAVCEHEATVSKVSDEQLFYLLSRGINQETAQSLIVNGFIDPIVKELPMEYAVELNRLIKLQMEGTVG